MDLDDIDFGMFDLPRLSAEEALARKAERKETARKMRADWYERKARKAAGHFAVEGE